MNVNANVNASVNPTQLVPCDECLRAIPVTELRYWQVLDRGTQEERGVYFCSAECSLSWHVEHVEHVEHTKHADATCSAPGRAPATVANILEQMAIRTQREMHKKSDKELRALDASRPLAQVARVARPSLVSVVA